MLGKEVTVRNRGLKGILKVCLTVATVLIILVSCSTLSIGTAQKEAVSLSQSNERQTRVAYTPRSPILIMSNAMFTSANGVTGGSGTAASPYIIEGWEIVASTAHAIQINNTDAYFVIRNCLVRDGTSTSKLGIYLAYGMNGAVEYVTSTNNIAGIQIYSFSNTRIENCTISSNSGSGIMLGGDHEGPYYATNNNITNCNIYNNGQGISISQYALYTTITKCSIYSHTYEGFELITSYVTIKDSLVYSNRHGIYTTSQSNNITITNCTVYQNSANGIYIYNSLYIKVTDCTAHNNSRYGIGIFCSSNCVLNGNKVANNIYDDLYVFGREPDDKIEYYCHDIDTSNTVAGKTVYYLRGESYVLIDGTTMSIGYLGLVSCNNIKIENLDLKTLLLVNVSNSLVNNCKVHHSSDYGIYLPFTSNTTITNCTIYANYKYGIFTFNSTYNNITSCAIYNISVIAVWMREGSSNNTLRGCSVYNNGPDYGYGIAIFDKATYNTIIECTIRDNAMYGLLISSGAKYNKIYNNNFINNAQGNGYDEEVSTNRWYADYPTGGNYWSDYTGVDNKSGVNQDQPGSDGIGDTAYYGPGDYGPYDRYPLMNPVGLKSLTFNLPKGWNFVTLPHANADITTAAQLATAIGANCTHIANWTGSSFVTYDKITGANNFILEPGRGYLVHTVNGTTKFKLLGSKITTVSTALTKGWNNIGLINSTYVKASDLAVAIGDCQAVGYWDSAQQRFVIHPVGTSINNFTLEIGKGYLVFVTASKVWTQTA